MPGVSAPSDTPSSDVQIYDPAGEIRGVWISYNELSELLCNASAEEFERRVSELFSVMAADGINTVFVHARAFADSFYPSELFPWSKYVTGTQGVSPGYDPLEIMIDRAHDEGLEFNAWFNPFRVSSSPSLEGLSADNPAVKILSDSDGSNDSLVYIGEEGVYFNPSSQEVHRLVIDGVREVTQRYDIDGVHIDDYFYPTVAKDIDRADYAAYLGEGGKLSLSDWRRSAVNAFVAGLYEAVKSDRPEAIVSISPSGDIERNYSELFADVREWSHTPGYADVIMPQLYYGFEHSTMPFEAISAKWEKLVRGGFVRLAPGLAAYKTGCKDPYAGYGAKEWVMNSDVLARQIESLRTLPDYSGFSLFSYSYLWGDRASDTACTELQNIKKILMDV